VYHNHYLLRVFSLVGQKDVNGVADPGQDHEWGDDLWFTHDDLANTGQRRKSHWHPSNPSSDSYVLVYTEENFLLRKSASTSAFTTEASQTTIVHILNKYAALCVHDRRPKSYGSRVDMASSDERTPTVADLHKVEDRICSTLQSNLLRVEQRFGSVINPPTHDVHTLMLQEILSIVGSSRTVTVDSVVLGASTKNWGALDSAVPDASSRIAVLEAENIRLHTLMQEMLGRNDEETVVTLTDQLTLCRVKRQSCGV
jgi:hypothetical protein